MHVDVDRCLGFALYVSETKDLSACFNYNIHVIHLGGTEKYYFDELKIFWMYYFHYIRYINKYDNLRENDTQELKIFNFIKKQSFFTIIGNYNLL